MIILTNNFQLNLNLAIPVTTQQLQFYASFSDCVEQCDLTVSALSSIQGGTNYGLTNNNTEVVFVGSCPLALINQSTSRKIDCLTVYNADSANADVIISLVDGFSDTEMIRITVAPGQTLQYNPSGWSIV